MLAAIQQGYPTMVLFETKSRADVAEYQQKRFDLTHKRQGLIATQRARQTSAASERISVA